MGVQDRKSHCPSTHTEIFISSSIKNPSLGFSPRSGRAFAERVIRGDVPATRSGVVCLVAIISKNGRGESREEASPSEPFFPKNEKNQEAEEGSALKGLSAGARAGAQPLEGVSALWIRNPTSGGAARIVKPRRAPPPSPVCSLLR